MNTLVIASRFPWPSFTGDRMRASIWLAALAPHGQVALVAPQGEVPKHAPAIRYFPARRSVARGIRGAVTIVRKGLPVQSLMAAPFAWDAAIDKACQEAGPFDATVVILSRVDPWVRAAIGKGGLRILDSIDSLRRNADERASAASLPMRLFWRAEERRLARLERELPAAYDHVVVVSEAETGEFGGGAMAIENSVPMLPLDPAAPRRYDFGYWGRLAYFANADAARWLLEEIIPAIRERHPSATFVIGGADAPASIKQAAERAAVDLQSPIANVAELARNVRVAIVPTRYGSGQSSKLLEAGEAGCAIVASPEALRGLPRIAPHAAVAADSTSIAAAAVALLRDEPRRQAMAAALRHAVEGHHSRAGVLAAMAAVVSA
jgi:glycosyltransferase involved in cell wall biosynthesis